MGYYDAIAKSYDELHKEEQLKKLSIIKSHVNPDKNTKLLDVGCGTGISSGFGCFMVGIDPSMGLLRQNKNRNKVLGIAEELPFRSSSFDYVVCVTALHNFMDAERALLEMKRVGNKNFVFSVFKKSVKSKEIERLIKRHFNVHQKIEEEKDVIFFCGGPWG